jgi:hypothetical protein
VVSILTLGVRADDKAVKETPFWRLINDPVAILPIYRSLPAKKGSGDGLFILATAVLDVTDGCLGSPLLPYSTLDIIGFHYCH